MMKQNNKLVAFAVAVFCLVNPLSLAKAEMARYYVDLNHSTVGFQAVQFLISKINGKFMKYDGFIEMNLDTKEVKAIEAVIHTESVNTNQKSRDKDLRSSNFFNVEKHPIMKYKMKSYKKTGDQYTAIGELTLLGVTKEITLVGSFNGVAIDNRGNTRASFSGEGIINRRDFGMKYNKIMDNGGLVIGNEVKIILEIAVNNKKKGKESKR